jgi:tetratricopeptide (TPR) repeat protein
VRPAQGARAWRHLLPSLLVLAAAVAAAAGQPLQAVREVWNGYSFRGLEGVAAAPALWLRALRFFAWPHPLCADHTIDLPGVLAVAAGLLAVAATVALALALRRRAPGIAYGLAWMLLAFLPVSNLLPLLNPFAERYLYLLAPGWSLLLSSVLLAPSASSHRSGLLLTFRAVAIPTLALGYTLLATARTGDWRDDATFWSATLRANPRSARALTWTGLMAKQRGDLAVARAYFESAERLRPQDIAATVNLAVLDGEAGDLAAAEARLREAMRRRPDRDEPRRNLILCLRLQGREAEAAALEQRHPISAH